MELEEKILTKDKKYALLFVVPHSSTAGGSYNASGNYSTIGLGPVTLRYFYVILENYSGYILEISAPQVLVGGSAGGEEYVKLSHLKKYGQLVK